MIHRWTRVSPILLEETSHVFCFYFSQEHFPSLRDESAILHRRSPSQKAELQPFLRHMAPGTFPTAVLKGRSGQHVRLHVRCLDAILRPAINAEKKKKPTARE